MKASDLTPATEDSFLDEILAQPQTLEAAGQGLLEQAAQLADLRSLFRRAGNLPLVLTGMGSSLDALEGLASVLARNGVSVTTVNTAELVHFRLPSIPPGSLVLAVSQSGLSAEIVRLADTLSDRGYIALASITNGLDNPLALAAGITFDMCAGSEVGPATKTYAATTVVLSAVARMLTEQQEPADVAARTATLAAENALAMKELSATPHDLAADMRAWAAGRDNLVFVGRGVAIATAELAGLVLKEAAQVAALSLDAAEFRHGPLELAGPSLAAVVISLEPTSLALDRRLLQDLATGGGAVLAVGLTDPDSPARRIVLDPIDALMDTARAAVPLQLLAWTLAQERHPLPGQFLVGSKVTTQE
jgi:glutamine---fructose-6-phosphate transaminase (isomerizing)